MSCSNYIIWLCMADLTSVTQTFYWQCLMDEDTDTLLALICSLLPDNITPSQESLLDALLQTNGDVEKAAEIISKQRLNGKRKRKDSLDSWLIRTNASSNDANGQSSSLQNRLGSESPNKKPHSAS